MRRRRRYQPPTCAVCGRPLPSDNCYHADYRLWTCHPTCSDHLRALCLDRTDSPRGRWRTKRELLAALHGEPAPWRPRPSDQPPVIPAGPHVLLGWQVGPQKVAAWCGLCLDWHYHGRAPGEAVLARAAHCACRPNLGWYHVAVVGPMTPSVAAWVRLHWGHQIRHRAHLRRQRGACWTGRLCWPRPWSPTSWSPL